MQTLSFVPMNCVIDAGHMSEKALLSVNMQLLFTSSATFDKFWPV